MRMVDNSYLGSSDDVTKLMERVEATFIKHFSNANRTKGMNILRPNAKRERHRVTFSTGKISTETDFFIKIINYKNGLKTNYLQNLIVCFSANPCGFIYN